MHSLYKIQSVGLWVISLSNLMQSKQSNICKAHAIKLTPYQTYPLFRRLYRGLPPHDKQIVVNYLGILSLGFTTDRVALLIW